MTGHTPGPWFHIYVPDNDSHEIRDENRLHNGRLIAEAFVQGYRTDANARLIAASPDLLAALKRVARKIDKASGSPKFTEREHNKLELLIAKAEGKDR